MSNQKHRDGVSTFYKKSVERQSLTLQIVDATTSNLLNLGFGAAGFIPGVGWIISGSYFFVNIGVQIYSGKSIGEHIDD